MALKHEASVYLMQEGVQIEHTHSMMVWYGVVDPCQGTSTLHLVWREMLNEEWCDPEELGQEAEASVRVRLYRTTTVVTSAGGACPVTVGFTLEYARHVMCQTECMEEGKGASRVERRGRAEPTRRVEKQVEDVMVEGIRSSSWNLAVLINAGLYGDVLLRS
ncbi:hypothetical protein BU24DRAFT_455809 [Aaosphaeria arxii CBS 175.79]|uniref:Uncharacterized protein n=1 Tax=Aaosphaeria arxii CBS 175.79 TaxID=1450172 RepID=A0A6A5X8P9_9PLEO|nr:uncharacterized protein BU24DRAFT_455809 [Aaosphaeria arxii CBS 175.79]KAF2009291.1 hypothetical protein BU24DRAFT_455809 [Aaosphaeria arxii CBS 175.79]